MHSRVFSIAVTGPVRVFGGVRRVLPVVQTPQVVAVLVGDGVVVEAKRRDNGGAESVPTPLIQIPVRW